MLAEHNSRTSVGDIGSWEDLVPSESIAELAEAPFLRACRDGTISFDTMRLFMAQHFHYSQYFTRYLCAVMASLPSNDDVRDLCENLFEEMGLDGTGRITHAELYSRSMRLANVDPQQSPRLASTQQLIDTMFEYCRNRDPLPGLSALCLGAEAIVPSMYEAIVEGCRRVGIPEAALEYFLIHIEDDDAHARTMRKIIDRLIRQHPERMADSRNVASDMISKRLNLFSEIMSSTA